jgi:disulfide bond formation protein DsbB
VNTADRLRVATVSQIKPNHSVQNKILQETMKRQKRQHKWRLFLVLSISMLLVVFNAILVITLD